MQVDFTKTSFDQTYFQKLLEKYDSKLNTRLIYAVRLQEGFSKNEIKQIAPDLCLGEKVTISTGYLSFSQVAKLSHHSFVVEIYRDQFDLLRNYLEETTARWSNDSELCVADFEFVALLLEKAMVVAPLIEKILIHMQVIKKKQSKSKEEQFTELKKELFTDFNNFLQPHSELDKNDYHRSKIMSLLQNCRSKEVIKLFEILVDEYDFESSFLNIFLLYHRTTL